MERIVLASSSHVRAQMLQASGVDFVVRTAPVDERSHDRADPAQLALYLADLKAKAVAALEPAALVLGADQVGWLVDERGMGLRLDKPADPRDHLDKLRAMRGRAHTLFAAWALWRGGDAQRVAGGVAEARLWMRAELSDDELLAYVACGEGAFCAGGYALEGRGAALFERVEGDYFTILGLPVFDVLTALRARGWRMT